MPTVSGFPPGVICKYFHYGNIIAVPLWSELGFRRRRQNSNERSGASVEMAKKVGEKR